MNLRAWLVAMVMATVVSGCVTETTGGLPQPAAQQERVQARLDLARGYLEKHDYVRARQQLNTALEIDPKSVEAHVLMAVLDEAESEIELAEKHYQMALRYDPEHPQALNNYASFLYRQQRYTEAVELLRVLVRNPDYRARSQAYENLGLAELITGNRERAREAFARALRLNAGQARSSLELADIAYADGNYRFAHEYYEGYRSRARQTARSFCLGMKISQAVGDTDQVASYALALQNLYPDSREARECEVPK